MTYSEMQKITKTIPNTHFGADINLGASPPWFTNLLVENSNNIYHDQTFTIYEFDNFNVVTKRGN